MNPIQLAGRSLIRSLAIAALFCITAAAAGAGSVAMVTDLSGMVTTQETDSGDQSKALRILQRIRPGTIISLSAESYVTLHYPATRTDFRFQGPNVIRVSEGAAVGSEGSAETRQHGDIGVSLDTSDTDLGAIAMRSLGDFSPELRLSNPVDTIVLLSRPTEFKWQSDPEFKDFQFTLATESGQPVISTFTGDARVLLPHGVNLEPNTGYRWSVRADTADGRSSLATADFSTASTDIEARFFRLSILNRGEISDRVLYSLYLDALGLHIEADAARQALESIRPGISGESSIR